LNAPTNTQPIVALSSADVQTRIDDERRRLLIEQNLEHDLTGQRIAPLEAGDDAALDRVEAQINQCRDRQFRIQERLEILEKRLAESHEREAGAELDALTDRANRARELGEKLIRTEYEKHATALAGVLGKLAAVDRVIDIANLRLARAGREYVAGPNGVRARAAVRVEKTRTVRLAPSHTEHPSQHSGDAEWSERGREFRPGNWDNNPGWISKSTGERIEAVEITVPDFDHTPGYVPDPLIKVITLPAVQADDAPLWYGARPEVSDIDIEALMRELDTGKPQGKLSKTAGRLLASLAS
jgi:chaperonin cofactor prefoldin